MCVHVFCNRVAWTVKSAGQQPSNGFVPVLAHRMVLHSWPCPLRLWQTYLVGECVVAACCHLTTLTVHGVKRGLQLFRDSPSLQFSGAVRRSSVAGGLRMAHHVQFKGAKKVGSPGPITRGGCCCAILFICLVRGTILASWASYRVCLTCLARMLRTSDRAIVDQARKNRPRKSCPSDINRKAPSYNPDTMAEVRAAGPAWTAIGQVGHAFFPFEVVTCSVRHRRACVLFLCCSAIWECVLRALSGQARISRAW